MSLDGGINAHRTNPNANDHTGVEILPTIEEARASWQRTQEAVDGN